MTKEPNRQNAPHATEAISVNQLDAIATQLQKWADELRYTSATAKEMNLDSIASYYLTSAELGMKRFKTFINAVEESRLALQLGKPIEIGKLKPRSTAIAKDKSKRKREEESADELVKEARRKLNNKTDRKEGKS